VKEYTEEFYKLNIRAGHRENDEEKVVRYINGLRYEIQDDIIMMTMRTVEDYYQVALKAEEKLERKQSQRNRGKNQTEEKEPPERSSRNSGKKLEDLIVRQREEEVLEEDTLKEETLFPEAEEEAEEEK
jgi:hypothetical protein